MVNTITNCWRLFEDRWSSWMARCGCATVPVPVAIVPDPEHLYQELAAPTLEQHHVLILEIFNELEKMKSEAPCCCGRDAQHNVEGYMQMRPFPPPRMPLQAAIYREWLQERLEI